MAEDYPSCLPRDQRFPLLQVASRVLFVDASRAESGMYPYTRPAQRLLFGNNNLGVTGFASRFPLKSSRQDAAVAFACGLERLGWIGLTTGWKGP
jgi:hypothetical protein